MSASILDPAQTRDSTIDTPACTSLHHDEIVRVCEVFHREGFVHIPGILPARAARLRDKIDRFFADERLVASHHRNDDIVMVRMFELDCEFLDLLTAEPFISIAEHLLGEQCHLIAQNVVRNPPGRAIDHFHVDDELQMPLPPELAAFDPRMQMPLHVFTIQILLSDVPDVAHGPTQFVPRSHYSGRIPNDPHAPAWDGSGPQSILGRAGDIYLHNGQCWHRGAPNASDRTRYLLQHAYGRRWVAQRFYPFTGYTLPEHVRGRISTDPRAQRILGHHPKGAYG